MAVSTIFDFCGGRDDAQGGSVDDSGPAVDLLSRRIPLLDIHARVDAAHVGDEPARRTRRG